MKRTVIFIFIGLSIWGAGYAQNPLVSYIDTAFQQNIQLAQRALSYQKQLVKVREANAQLLPVLSVQARLSMARGGRAINIPVGDLINPVYSNLNVVNQLGTQISDTYPAFPPYPEIDNVQENFLRRQEQETVIRMQAPIYNAALISNRRIQGFQKEVMAADLAGYRRQLVRDVKRAYFTYLRAWEGFQLYVSTLSLVEENLRTTQSLFDNHKITQDEVFSAEARVREIEQQLAVANQQEQSARAYFNYLLNRPLSAPIERMANSLQNLPNQSLTAARQSIAGKEELAQLDYAIQATEEVVQLERSAFLPAIGIQADYGVQGVDYRIDAESDFFLGSVVLTWTLFDQSAKRRVEQATLDVGKLQHQKAELRSQLELQAIDAWYAWQASKKKIEQARAEVEASVRSYELIEKKYRQGQANVLERSQARTQMTNAEARLILARYDEQIQAAELEYATAAFAIEKK